MKRPKMTHEDPATFIREDLTLPRHGRFGRRSPPYDWERVLFWAIIVFSCIPEMVDRFRDIAPAVVRLITAKLP